MKARNMVFVSVLVAAVLTFLYIWPGVWRYSYRTVTTKAPIYSLAPEETTVYRTDRLTGEVCYSCAGHWIKGTK